MTKSETRSSALLSTRALPGEMRQRNYGSNLLARCGKGCAVVGLLLLVLGILNLLLPMMPHLWQRQQQRKEKIQIDARFVTNASMIGLRPQELNTEIVASTLHLHHLNISRVQAVLGREVDQSKVSLHVIQAFQAHMRHEGMQVSTYGMIGCFESHASQWRQIQPGEVWLMVEEDVEFSDSAEPVWAELARFLAADSDFKFDVVVLQNPIVPDSYGDHRLHHVGLADGKDVNLRQCVNNCMNYGSIAYLITYNGAQQLLHNAYPIDVQYDALISLLSGASNGIMRSFWLSPGIVHGPALLEFSSMSKVQDLCWKCYFFSSNELHFWLICGFGYTFFIAGVCFPWLQSTTVGSAVYIVLLIGSPCAGLFTLWLKSEVPEFMYG